MEKTLEELKLEADDLGITYSANIGAAKLAAKIEEFYASQETGGAVLAEAVKEKEAEVAKTGKRSLGERIEAAKKAAMVKHIVTITDNDQRENHLTTVVSVNCTNIYFDLGTKRIPLNTPVALEQGFIDVLKEIKIPMHVKDPQTNQSKTVIRSRYSIAYETELEAKNKNLD